MITSSYSTDCTELYGLVKFGVLGNNFQRVSGSRLGRAWINLPFYTMDTRMCYVAII